MPVPDVQTILGTKKKSVSGIVEQTLTGDRIVPETRRADGSIRKERKIRPGYTPPEEVEKFKSARQLDQERNARPRGAVPGMSAGAIAALQAAANGGTGRSSQRNPKSKEVRDESANVPPRAAAKKAVEATPEDWDAESGAEEVKESPAPQGSKELLDPEKRVKALNKKLRQAQSLRERQAAGESLLPEQEEKVNSIDSLTDELAKLSMPI